MPDISFPFQGGLNLVTDPMNIPPGALLGCRNYEIALSGGYRRLDGYTLFDGRLSGASPPPGSGPVRGVHLYDGTVYAFRDNAGGTAGAMHKATGSGWSAVALGRSLSFTSGGTYVVAEGDTITGATSGAEAVITRVVVTSGDWSTGDAAGSLIFASQTGTFQSENLNVGGNLNVATIAADSSAITLPAGGSYEFVNHNFYGASDRFRMYGVNGVGTGFEFDGTVFVPILTTMTTDTPSHVAAFRGHLFFSFPGGSVQHSGIGNPYVWSPILGASELGASEDVTDFQVEVGPSLFTFCRNRTWVLYGTSSSDWDWQEFSTDTGAIAGTVQKIGKTVYFDDRGVLALGAAQEYGNFTSATISRDVAPLIQTLKDLGVSASVVAREKGQYRLFFGKRALYLTFNGNKLMGAMEVEFPVEVKCAVSGENSAGEEEIYFGDESGNVYRMDYGTSFNGGDIAALLRFPYYSYKSPLQRKQFRRALFEANAEASASVYVAPEFDYGGDDPGVDSTLDMTGGQGWWDLSNMDAFNWSEAYSLKGPIPMEGLGINMGFLISSESATIPAHTLFGVTVVFDYRGRTR